MSGLTILALSPATLLGAKAGVALLLCGVLVLVSGADLGRIGGWMLTGGWFLFALTSPTAQFPVKLRMLGVVAAAAGAILLRTQMTTAGTEGLRRRGIPATSRLLFLYLVFVLLGCLASPKGPTNLVRGAQGVLIVLTAYYAVDLGRGRQLLGATFAAAFANVVLTLRSGGHEVLWNGDTTNRLSGYMQPNHLAFACMLVIIGAVWLLPQHPRWRVPLAGLAAISGYALLASRSRTALTAMLAGLIAATIATYFVEGRRARIATAAFAGLLLLGPVMVPMLGTWFNRDASTESITSLTGRTDLWPHAIELIGERPVIGWGVDVITTSKGEEFQKVLPGVSQAHNAYLEAALIAGIPGLVCWAFALFGLTLGAFALPRDCPERFLLIACAIVLQLFAVTESSPAFFGDMFIVFALASALYAKARSQVPALEPAVLV